MSLITFDYFEKNSTIKILGNKLDKKSLECLLDLLKKIKNSHIKNVKFIGSFNSELLLENFFNEKKNKNIDQILDLFHSICKIMQESKVFFTSEISGLVKGPALEIALSCNYIRARNDTIIEFNQIGFGIMPFFGTAQRLLRLIGYQSTLEALITKKKLTFDESLKLGLINNEKDSLAVIKNKKIVWGQNFTNTFIFFNSRALSICKDQKNQYKALLSTIFEGCVCHYDKSLEIEKRWLKWLITKEMPYKKA